MALVEILIPASEAELLVTVGLLAAHGIPVHVRGAGIGSLYPGPRVPSYNERAILVPEDLLEEAHSLLAASPVDFAADEDDHSLAGISPTSRFRVLIEFLLFGWFLPPTSPRQIDPTGSPKGGREPLD